VPAGKGKEAVCRIPGANELMFPRKARNRVIRATKSRLRVLSCALTSERGRPAVPSIVRTVAAAALWIGIALCCTPGAGAEPLRAPVVREHQGTFNGVSVRYRSVVAETDVPNAKGGPGARLVSTAYLADGVADPDRRPVIFLFNGGPITSSVYVHMGAFGPRRVVLPADLSASVDKALVVDNHETLLDVADLVFVDPAGTGYSRVDSGVSPQSYYSVDADAQQVSQFIYEWLRDNGRLESPQYVFGESYGTIRAAKVAQMLLDLPHPVRLKGVVLLGEGLNLIEYAQRPANIISYVVSLPTLAATAWYHRAVPRRGRTVEQVYDEASAFARNDYLVALYDGDTIDPVLKRRIAERLETLTGIGAAYYLAHDLRITKEQYRRELLRPRNLILGRSDTRYVAPVEGARQSDPSDVIGKAAENAFPAYARDFLGVSWNEQYRFGVVPKNGVWDYGGSASPFSNWPFQELITEVMKRVPTFRVMVGAGYYDTETTAGASDYLLTQSGWPRDRSRLVFYEGGHMAYSNDKAFHKLMRDVRAFVRP
jgi:carboxypeptidase C (cathepsin A)